MQLDRILPSLRDRHGKRVESRVPPAKLLGPGLMIRFIESIGPAPNLKIDPVKPKRFTVLYNGPDLAGAAIIPSSDPDGPDLFSLPRLRWSLESDQGQKEGQEGGKSIAPGPGP